MSMETTSISNGGDGVKTDVTKKKRRASRKRGGVNKTRKWSDRFGKKKKKVLKECVSAAVAATAADAMALKKEKEDISDVYNDDDDDDDDDDDPAAPNFDQYEWDNVDIACEGMEGLISFEELDGFDVMEDVDTTGGKTLQLLKGKSMLSKKKTKKEKQQQLEEEEKEEDNVVGEDDNDNHINDGSDEEAEDMDETNDNVMDVEDDDDDDDDGIDMSEWQSLGVDPLLRKGLKVMGFAIPTPIQRATLPAAITQYRDVVGAAETGSGKTLAFGLPALNVLLQLRERADYCSMPRKLRVLILSPTRELAVQIRDHLAAVARFIQGLRVVAIVGGMSEQKQARLLSQCPEIVVATPGRLHALMTAPNGSEHLKDLTGLRFFVLDEADRMVEKGHFAELDDIINRLPAKQQLRAEEWRKDAATLAEKNSKKMAAKNKNKKENIDIGEGKGDCEDEDEDEDATSDIKSDFIPPPEILMDSEDDKKRVAKLQTLVFSATLSLPNQERKIQGRQDRDKPKDKVTPAPGDDTSATVAHLISRLSLHKRAHIVDLSTKNAVAEKLVEGRIFCIAEEKDHLLYYFLCRFPGRTLIFANSVSCIRRLLPILQALKPNVFGLHANMQQRQRLKNLERFRASSDGVIVATDVAARGLDIPQVQHVIHYQLPRAADIYVHRSGRTARADQRGVSVALVAPEDQALYKKMCYTLNRPDGIPPFDIETSYLPAIKKRVSLARQIDKLVHRRSRVTAHDSWLLKAALECDLPFDSSQLEGGNGEEEMRALKMEKLKLESLRNELASLLKMSLLPSGTSRSFITNGMIPDLPNRARNMESGGMPCGPLDENVESASAAAQHVGVNRLKGMFIGQRAGGRVGKRQKKGGSGKKRR